MGWRARRAFVVATYNAEWLFDGVGDAAGRPRRGRPTPIDEVGRAPHCRRGRRRPDGGRALRWRPESRPRSARTGRSLRSRRTPPRARPGAAEQPPVSDSISQSLAESIPRLRLQLWVPRAAPEDDRRVQAYVRRSDGSRRYWRDFARGSPSESSTHAAEKLRQARGTSGSCGGDCARTRSGAPHHRSRRL